MPYVVVKDEKACSVSKPWAVKNQLTGDVRGRCHSTKAKARDQQMALYAGLRKEGKLTEYFLAPIENLFADNPLTATDNIRWIQVFPYDSWDHPVYGTTTVDKSAAQQYVKNFKDNVRGQDLAINYDHGEDKAKGNKAAGWIRDLSARDNGLFAKVEFNPPAVEELKNGEWRYFSSESFDTWTNPNTKETHQYVLTGGALTNKPWVKGMLPINFSEVMTEEDLEEAEKEFAVWSAKYVNTLPDSAFLYVESGNTKDGSGKTIPRSARHLPYKDDGGKLDLAHLRNAIARIPQMAGISQSLKDSLQKRARSLLSASQKNASEATLEALDILLQDESKEWEHSDPGTGEPPNPRQDEDGSDDPAIKEGWRRDIPPDAGDLNDEAKFAESTAMTYLKTGIDSMKKYVSQDPQPMNAGQVMSWISQSEDLLSSNVGDASYADLRCQLGCMPYVYTSTASTNGSDTSYSEGGKKLMAELTEGDVRELRMMFEVDDDAKIVESAKLKFGELNSLRKAVSAADQERAFAEQYPQFWDEHNKLMERDRKNSAKNFSESVKNVRRAEGYGLKETTEGLSTKALDTLIETHMKFSEGTATVEEFENCIKTIINGGIVKFGEVGSTKEGDENRLPDVDMASPNGISQARKLFAEVISRTQTEHPDWDYMTCVNEAGKKHPDLAEAYKVTLPA